MWYIAPAVIPGYDKKSGDGFYLTDQVYAWFFHDAAVINPQFKLSSEYSPYYRAQLDETLTVLNTGT